MKIAWRLGWDFDRECFEFAVRRDVACVLRAFGDDDQVARVNVYLLTGKPEGAAS